MKKALLAGVAGAMFLGMASAANATSYQLVTLGFVFGTYSNQSDCFNAGAAITSNVNGGSNGDNMYIPNFFCVPVTDQTTNFPAVGGGYSKDL